MDFTYQIKSLLFAVAVGDAIGLPVEFESRQTLSEFPITSMIGNGTYNQPLGTFSDDSSLTFCLAEALIHGCNPDIIGQYFVKWYIQNFWTPRGHVFDIGFTTRTAIEKIANGVKTELAGCGEVSCNGNGSLMRIAPLVFYLYDKPIKERFEITQKVSSITHAHIRSSIACFYFLEFLRQLLEGKHKFDIYKNLQSEIPSLFNLISISQEEIQLFDRLLKLNICEFTEDKIFTSTYVLHTLEASIWCLLTTETYKEAVLRAVNLGEDTDTTGAVTGALAGLLYGFDAIPQNWAEQIVRKDDIKNLAERFAYSLHKPKFLFN